MVMMLLVVVVVVVTASPVVGIGVVDAIVIVALMIVHRGGDG